MSTEDIIGACFFILLCTVVPATTFIVMGQNTKRIENYAKMNMSHQCIKAITKEGNGYTWCDWMKNEEK